MHFQNIIFDVSMLYFIDTYKFCIKKILLENHNCFKSTIKNSLLDMTSKMLAKSDYSLSFN